MTVQTFLACMPARKSGDPMTKPVQGVATLRPE